MKTVNIHEAKTHLSRLVEEAASGDSFIIAKAGKPMVKVMALAAPEPKKMRRMGFMKGIGTAIPDNFNEMFDKEIAELFGFDEDEAK